MTQLCAFEVHTVMVKWSVSDSLSLSDKLSSSSSLTGWFEVVGTESSK